MRPKDKAKELTWKFLPITKAWLRSDSRMAVKCALACVDEILTFVPYETYKETLPPYDGSELSTDYWNEVKEEINKI